MLESEDFKKFFLENGYEIKFRKGESGYIVYADSSHLYSPKRCFTSIGGYSREILYGDLNESFWETRHPFSRRKDHWHRFENWEQFWDWIKENEIPLLRKNKLKCVRGEFKLVRA
jgi:hypothetical protein